MSLQNQRRTKLRRLTFSLIVCVASTMLANTVLAQQPSPVPVPAHPSSNKTPAKKVREESDGERVFAANCSRCHTAPDGFSPRISGTILRHMRVRASLSEKDEKALLRFFNPQ